MKFSRWIGGLVLLTALLSGCQQESTPQVSAPAPSVSYVKVSTGTHQIDAKMQARVVASQIAEVRPQVGGIIQERLFEEGSIVEEGQLLYQIDPATFQAAYNEAKANLSSAEASLETAQLKNDRYAKLVKIEGVSQQEADDAYAAYLEAKADIEKYKAALETASINLEYTKVKAPISGHIGISSVTKGALVTAQQSTALATIQTLNPVYVDMTQRSTELLKLRKLMHEQAVRKGSTAVTLTLEDGSEYDHEGQLKAQEVSVDASTGSVTLRAEFPNPDGLLLPGMFVRSEVNEAVNEGAIVVPQQGIHRAADGQAYAYVIDDDNRVERRTVETSDAVENKWVIVSGLSVDDKLLVEGSDKVRPGSEVNPIQVEMNSNGAMVTVTEPESDESSSQGGV